MTAEETRLVEARGRRVHWYRWGPYVSERQWGTVREDYSADGSAWEYLPHDHARSRAYRWGEDGIAGISDNHQRLCFAIAVWNGVDSILKERLFGLSGPQGNHGEDVKERYFHLDNTPSHAYMEYLYVYPQRAFPYDDLVKENARRGKADGEYELDDTHVFDGGRYFDVMVRYAKAGPEDILVRIAVRNRGPERATLHVLPTLWFRNTWTWHPGVPKPLLGEVEPGVVEATHPTLGRRYLHCKDPREVLFTENESNAERLWGAPNASPFVKDAFHTYLVDGREDAVNRQSTGTKCAAHYVLDLAAGEERVVQLRLTDRADISQPFGDGFDETFAARLREADEFYARINPFETSAPRRALQRRAFAGLLWSKQYYRYIVKDWLDGDPGAPPPPEERKHGRNHEWLHVHTDDILAMPDKWEYPWFASWDLAFHVVPLAMIDPEFAKRQLVLLTREWYMHPNGQLPAYEWAFGDANPPVHAWAALRIYQIERKMRGAGDRLFLERVFQKLLMNFTWWLNRKDADDNDVFQGGFLGLDNIGVFDRSAKLPTGGHIDQADGTSWMAMYALNMLAIALELAPDNPAYEDIATKFFEHFLRIADAMNHVSESDVGLWDEEDGFYYDVLHLPDGRFERLAVRSIVGIIPLFAVQILEPDVLAALPDFARKMEWFIRHRPDLRENVACMETEGIGARRLLAICGKDRLRRLLSRMLDETEFLSDGGVRSLSKQHLHQPFVLTVEGMEHRVAYEPAESRTGVFGGNSNWRGPVWFPINFLIVEALQKFDYYLGDGFTIECPTGSGKMMNLWHVAAELSRRLVTLCEQAVSGWPGRTLFFEYFDGDTGRGLGACQQTGWTAIVAKLLQQAAEYRDKAPDRDA
jgi:hypothetical protein